MAKNSTQEYLLEITCERSLVKQVVRVVLHAILFQRCLRPLAPRKLEICDLAFVAVQDTEMIADEVETHADIFARSLEQPSTRTRKIRLSFYERQRPAPKPKAQSWFPYAAAGSERDRDDKPFETWTLEVTVVPASSERERSKLARVTRAQLANFQLNLLRFANDCRAHLPAVTKEVDPYPFEIEVNPGGSAGDDVGFMPAVRRMLSEPS